jgi:hypothetical protein
MLRWFQFVVLCLFACAQSDVGELRIKVLDQAGLPIPGTIELISQSNGLRRTVDTDRDGNATARRLPFGLYSVHVERSGFAPLADVVEIRSAIPREMRITMSVAPIETAVTVRDVETLLDPHKTGTVNRIGAEAIQDRLSSRPGRSLLDLVNTQPGWLLEANGVLHPRGSEYQTQYIVDGIPLTENRSPAFSPELEADDVQSVSILTAGYPAEYGRKLGGVIDVTTQRDSQPGFHGHIASYGGSFDTFGGSAAAQYGWGKNTFSVTGDAARTDRYLDPPVEWNYTNAGSNSDYTAHYERDLSEHDRLGIILRGGESRFQVPNELVQQQAGQRQDRGANETAGQIIYQHVFSPSIIGDLRGMVRDTSATLWSNPYATPMYASQDRGLRESYVKGSISAHQGRNEWKAGVEADFGSIHENFGYLLTDPAQFDPGTPPGFTFANRAQDREQGLFVQDLIRLGNLTVNAGVRWDHYGLIVHQSAASPRLGAAWYWRGGDMVFRASYDRIFQTPAFENILLASSPAVDVLNANVLRLPVRPSLGNFYEAGFAKAFFGKLRLDANYYRRAMNNFADDDLLLNTGVSFPIAFQRADIHGVEVKLEIPRWGPVSGFVSYSNMLGIGYLPVTGGLFLGDNAAAALGASGSFPVTQDQRNTVQSRFRYQAAKRLWFAFGGAYGSGLPVEFDGTLADALAQYGSRIVDRINFDRGRVRPSFSLNASAGTIVFQRERRRVRFEAEFENLTNRLNVIDFAGLFSGTALAPPRSATLRLTADF